MRLEAAHEIQAPIELVFGKFCDFDRLQSFTENTGREAVRLDDGTATGAGVRYLLKGKFGGKQRSIELGLETCVPTVILKYEVEVETLTAALRFDFEKRAAELTRVSLILEPTAHSISSRLILQSVKLAKRTMEKRMETRLFHFGNEIVEEYRGKA